MGLDGDGDSLGVSHIGGASPKPSLFQTEQSQLSRPLLWEMMFAQGC